MHTRNCPKCGTAKTKLAPRSGITDRLLGTLTIYPLRCQLCAHRFTTFLGKLKTNPRRNYERVPVQYSAQVRPVHDPTQRIVVDRDNGEPVSQGMSYQNKSAPLDGMPRDAGTAVRRV